MNVADQFNSIYTGYEIEDRKIVRNLFDELLSLDRAACMIEIHAPIELIHQGEYFIREHGYHVFIRIIMHNSMIKQVLRLISYFSTQVIRWSIIQIAFSSIELHRLSR